MESKEVKENLRVEMRCDKCGSRNTVPITYGLPSSKDMSSRGSKKGTDRVRRLHRKQRTP